MTLKAYYDHSKDKKGRFLTLAGYVGTDESWTDLETQWKGILTKHRAPGFRSGLPYFHMSEAINHRNGYQAWTDERLKKLWKDLLNLLGRADRSQFKGFSCTIDLLGYKKAATALKKIKSPEHLCLDFCFGQALYMLQNEQDTIALCFDRGESFAQEIRARWKIAWWSKYVSSVTELIMKKSYGVQAADTLAWTANRYYSWGHNDKWGMFFNILFFVREQFHQLFDEQALIENVDPNGGYKAGAKFKRPTIKFPGSD